MKSNGKRLALTVVLLLIVLGLSSCSISELLASVTGVSEDPAYTEWQKLNTDGLLDDDGKYISKAVHVTFARNSFLEIRYYYDKEMTDANRVDEDRCYILPGACIYAKITEERNPYTDLYHFKAFRIWDYDEDGQRKKELEWYSDSGNLVFMLPDEYTGKEICVEPIGEYSERTLWFEDRIDGHPGKQVQGSTWTINGNTDHYESYKVDPVEPYTVKYHFDKERYFYVSSKPECFFAGDDTVYFEQAEPTEGNGTYSVTLQEYYTATIKAGNGKVESIKVNGQERPVNKTDNGYLVTRLKDMDQITIVSTVEGIELESEWNHKSPESKKENDKYTITYFPGGDGDFMLDPLAYTVNSGVLKFFVDGTEITTKRNIAFGKTIEYRIVDMDEDYWMPNGGKPVTVNGNETDDELRKIQVWPHKTVTIDLPQIPGGTVTYKANGERLSGEKAELYCGTVVTAEAEPWNGWKTNSDFPLEQIIQENTSGFDLGDDLFTETQRAKFTLKMKGNIHKASVAVTADDLELETNPVSYTSGDIIADIFNGTEKVTVNSKEIGSVNDIQISLQDTELTEGTDAIHVTVYRNDQAREEMDIAKNGSVSIPVYPAGDRTELCASVTVKLEATTLFGVDGIEHVTTCISDRDGKAIDAEYLLPDTRIKLLLTPDETSYFTGANVHDDCYEREMSYAEYKRDIGTIVSNQLKTKKKVTLITKGQYGTATYKLNGQECSGTVLMKETDKLEGEYTITDDGYEINTKTVIVFDSKVTHTTYQFYFAELEEEANVEAHLDIRKKGN